MIPGVPGARVLDAHAATLGALIPPRRVSVVRRTGVNVLGPEGFESILNRHEVGSPRQIQHSQPWSVHPVHSQSVQWMQQPQDGQYVSEQSPSCG